MTDHRFVEVGIGPEVTAFLMVDSVTYAKAGQQTPDGCNNLERMVKQFVPKGTQRLSGTCLGARE